jgi:hypothetical protein
MGTSNLGVIGSPSLNNCVMSTNGLSCNVTITTANLPNHSHTIPLTYSKKSGCPKGGITPDTGKNGCYYGLSALYTGDGSFGASSLSPTSSAGGYLNNLLTSSMSYNIGTDANVINYNNLNTIGSDNGTTLINSKNANTPINILPPHYKMIYIMKVPIS